ncbi:MAG: phosphotransferase [Pseudomonadota bacterium]
MTLIQPLDTRQPARSTLSSSEPSSRIAPASEVKDILSKLHVDGKLFRLGSVDSESAYYRLELANESLFVKIVDDSYLDSQLAADAIARFASSKVKTSTLRDGFPVSLNAHSSILAYDWIEQQAPPSFYQLGSQIAGLHDVLRGYPNAADVQSRSQNRLTTLQEFLDSHLDEVLTDARLPQSAKEIISTRPEFFNSLSDSSQAIHGDLNAGNLRFCNDGVWFLDFEDARHSWFPVGIDVAFAIERLALIDEPDNDRALRNAESLIRGYYEESGETPFPVRGSLQLALEYLGVRSLILLKHFELQGTPWPESEWKKFDRLFTHIDERADLFAKLEQSC